jgi:hypothetical protein
MSNSGTPQRKRRPDRKARDAHKGERSLREKLNAITKDPRFIAVAGVFLAALIGGKLILSGGTTSPGPIRVPQSGQLDAYKDVRIVKSWSDRTSFVLRSSKAYSIPNGGVYTCNAEYYPVQFTEHPSALEPEHKGGDAHCPRGPLPNLLTALRTDYLLIERNRALHTEPVSNIWLLKNGVLYAVPPAGRVPTSGSLFTCLVRKYLGWDFVAQGTYRHFPEAHKVARCI